MSGTATLTTRNHVPGKARKDECQYIRLGCFFRDEVINELRILSLADKIKTEELKTLLSEATGHG